MSTIADHLRWYYMLRFADTAKRFTLRDSSQPKLCVQVTFCTQCFAASICGMGQIRHAQASKCVPDNNLHLLGVERHVNCTHMAMLYWSIPLV